MATQIKNIMLVLLVFMAISIVRSSVTDTSITITNCGDGLCNYGENCTTCVADCGVCSPQIGPGHGELSVPGTKKTNKTSNATLTPVVQNKSEPIPEITPIVCGDNICSSTENCGNCASDCGACPVEPPVLNNELAITPLQGGIITMAVLAAMGLGIYVSRKFSQASKYGRRK
jgi:hypothetical protein